MNVNTENLVSITEANQNFSRIARMVDEKGSVVILKNNSPRYLLIEFNQAQREQTASDEDIKAAENEANQQEAQQAQQGEAQQAQPAEAAQ